MATVPTLLDSCRTCGLSDCTDAHADIAAVRLRADQRDRARTAAYVPERGKGAHCLVCVGPAARGCYAGRHPYAYMVNHNASSAAAADRRQPR